jgi:branched-chain amino acid transport system ATP-binding protein
LPVSEPMFLDVRDLCVSYGRSQVLFDVSLAVRRRGAVAVLGRNGAGKTTLLKTIIGELEAGSGSIALDACDLLRIPTERRVRMGLGYVPPEHAVFGRLSVRENLTLGALCSRGSLPVERVLTMFPKLGKRLGQLAGTLSGGEQKMLAIGRALLSNPTLLLLDEPTEGVWIGVVEEIAERLQELAKELAIVIVEQHFDLALGLADYAYILERGRVALEGCSSVVCNDPRLLQFLAP